VLRAAPEARDRAVVILSFRVSRGCDLRRPVVDSVAGGTLAARLPTRTSSDRPDNDQTSHGSCEACVVSPCSWRGERRP
jgi:hypothetical protein